MLLAVPKCLCADSTSIATNASYQKQKTLFIELGGKFFPSLNYEIRQTEKRAINFGLGLWKDSEEQAQWLFIPSFSTLFFFGEKKRIEVGAGTGPFITSNKGFAAVLLFGNLGYRYQKSKHIFFRSTLNPFLGIPIANKTRFWVIPWAGLSIGYTF